MSPAAMPEASNGGFAANPSRDIEAAFRAIYTERMADTPIINPALVVEAVGFELNSAGWLGVLITPWFMNLMLLPAAGVAWQLLAVGEKRRIRLPAGEFEFFGGAEQAVGEYLYCSMFSPMSRFADHTAARATAREICRMLFDPAVAKQVEQLNPSGLKWFEPAPAPAAEAPVSKGRRTLLGGR